MPFAVSPLIVPATSTPVSVRAVVVSEMFRLLNCVAAELAKRTATLERGHLARAALEEYGVEKIYTPEDGRRLGLDGMMDDVFARVAAARHLDPARVRSLIEAQRQPQYFGFFGENRVNVLALNIALAQEQAPAQR